MLQGQTLSHDEDYNNEDHNNDEGTLSHVEVKKKKTKLFLKKKHFRMNKINEDD